jgi:hypothetical protein
MNRCRDNSASMPILMLVAVTVMTSAASLIVSRDMLVRDQVHTTLQIAADRAAMAGAAYLPGWPTRAVRAAEESVELSGFARSSMVNADVAPNRMSLRVALRCAAPVLLLGMFDDGDVSAVSMATARREGRWPTMFDRPAGMKFDRVVLWDRDACAFAILPTIAYLAWDVTRRDTRMIQS